MISCLKSIGNYGSCFELKILFLWGCVINALFLHLGFYNPTNIPLHRSFSDSPHRLLNFGLPHHSLQLIPSYHPQQVDSSHSPILSSLETVAHQAFQKQDTRIHPYVPTKNNDNIVSIQKHYSQIFISLLSYVIQNYENFYNYEKVRAGASKVKSMHHLEYLKQNLDGKISQLEGLSQRLRNSAGAAKLKYAPIPYIIERLKSHDSCSCSDKFHNSKVRAANPNADVPEKTARATKRASDISSAPNLTSNTTSKPEPEDDVVQDDDGDSPSKEFDFSEETPSKEIETKKADEITKNKFRQRFFNRRGNRKYSKNHEITS